MAAALQDAKDDTLRRLRPRPASEAQAVSGKTFWGRGFRAGNARKSSGLGL